MIDLEREKKNFQNHVATFTDYGNIKILDFKRPDSNEYRIRFLFEEDHYRLHISGDLGELIASNYKNMVFELFEEHFTDNTGYFSEKIDCMNRAMYYYDEEQAIKDIMEYLEEEEYLEGMQDGGFDIDLWVSNVAAFKITKGKYKGMNRFLPLCRACAYRYGRGVVECDGNTYMEPDEFSEKKWKEEQ